MEDKLLWSMWWHRLQLQLDPWWCSDQYSFSIFSFSLSNFHVLSTDHAITLEQCLHFDTKNYYLSTLLPLFPDYLLKYIWPVLIHYLIENHKRSSSNNANVITVNLSMCGFSWGWGRTKNYSESQRYAHILTDYREVVLTQCAQLCCISSLKL